MKKRGLSHLEAILSFVIFIGFLIFAFFFFNPLESNRVLDSSLEYTINEIHKASEIKIESYSVIINNDVPDQIVGINISTDFDPEVVNVSAFDAQDLKLEVKYDGDFIYIDRGPSGVNFISVSFGEGLGRENDVAGAILLEKGNYSISSSDVKKLVSENKLVELNYSYHGDYFELKKDFNLPNRVDFGFILSVDGDVRISAERDIPPNFEVISKIERINLIDLEGNIIFADLIIKTW